MAQSTRGFAGSKMNKDADERTVKEGEYRHALNIQVSSSDDSDVGSAQTLLGNTLISQNMVPAGSTCIGSIAHNKEDKVYYLVAGPAPTVDSWNFPATYRDYIIEYDIKTNIFKYVFVDIYQTNFKAKGVSEDRHIRVWNQNDNSGHNPISHVRYEMEVEGFDENGLQTIMGDAVSSVSVAGVTKNT